MGFIKTYRSKITIIALLGIQASILALVYCFWLFSIFSQQDFIPVILATLLMDLVISTIVSYVIYYLLTPISLTCNTLQRYIQGNQLNEGIADLQSNADTLMADTDDTLEKLEDIIYNLIHYDTLTGLPNRKLFQTYVEQAIATTEDCWQFSLIVLSINNLKNINNSLGRQTGDLLLSQIKQRLISCLAHNDTIARFGGNEFIVLRPNATDSNCSIALSNDLLNCLSQPFFICGKQIHCGVKIGITVYPFDGITVQELLQNADAAISQAKQQESNGCHFYSQEIGNRLKRNLAIEENLRYALEKNEFFLYYQPRIEMATGCLVGVEALLRWYNQELGWVSPNEFIPIAEATNLIMPIGEWVLRNACLQNKQWQKSQMPSLQMSVNLSPCQFKQQNLLDTIDRILDETGIDAACLELEITENALVKDIDTTVAVLWKLKRKGISIALDDFGTGYSSLSYLQKLPINTLKIDRSFVTNLTSGAEDTAIAKGIIALAQSLALNITAEGVETKAQFDYLLKRGCNEVQGYYFSRPLPVESIENFLLNYYSILSDKSSISQR